MSGMMTGVAAKDRPGIASLVMTEKRTAVTTVVTIATSAMMAEAASAMTTAKTAVHNRSFPQGIL
jgi:hypothetical protein